MKHLRTQLGLHVTVINKASYDELKYANRITVYHNKDNCLKSITQKILEMSKQSNFEEFLSNFERKKKIKN